MASYTKTITDLVDYLNVCRDAYYNKNTSIITDEQYDDLFDKLKLLENESGIVMSNSPTQEVGYKVVSGLEKVTHIKPLLSLDKTKSSQDIVKFCSVSDTLIMHKLDGLTIQLTYKDGDLVMAETRGDGYTGEDVTHNARTFMGIPKSIPLPGTIHVTGEAIINYADFQYINNSLPEDQRYKNPRNLASGSVRQLDSSVCSKRKVRFVVWNANDLSKDGKMLSGLEFARDLGFTVVHYYHAEASKINSGAFNRVAENMKARANYENIPIDGIAVMYNDISFGESLGSTSHHFKNGIAFKFYENEYTTILTDIEYTIGKTGVLTPTAVFEPVDIDGTIIARASVHNISILKKLNLRIGDEIDIYKANEIIPQIKRNNTRHEDSDINNQIYPRECPYCGKNTSIHYTVNNIEPVAVLKCTNDECWGKCVKQISFFVSKSGMDIEGLSEKTIEKFVKKGYLKYYHDIYDLIERHGNEVVGMTGFGSKFIDNLSRSIDNSKNVTLEKFITSLSINGIGKQNAKQLADYFDNDVYKIVDSFSTNNYVSLDNIEGFGPIISSDINKWFHDENNMNEFKTLISIMNFKNNSQPRGTRFSGMKFVITGSLKKFSNRDKLVSYINDNGGSVQSSVTKDTDYLINNDINSGSSKNKKAKELGVRIIDEDMFLNLVGDTDIKNEKTKNNDTRGRKGHKKLF